jgi:hypothetical protein
VLYKIIFSDKLDSFWTRTLFLYYNAHHFPELPSFPKKIATANANIAMVKCFITLAAGVKLKISVICCGILTLE